MYSEIEVDDMSDLYEGYQIECKDEDQDDESPCCGYCMDCLGMTWKEFI